MSEGGARRSTEQGLIVKGVFSDVYKLYLKYHGKPLDEALCQEKASDGNRILERYGYDPFCDRMLLTTFMQLEKESR